MRKRSAQGTGEHSPRSRQGREKRTREHQRREEEEREQQEEADGPTDMEGIVPGGGGGTETQNRKGDHHQQQQQQQQQEEQETPALSPVAAATTGKGGGRRRAGSSSHLAAPVASGSGSSSTFTAVQPVPVRLPPADASSVPPVMVPSRSHPSNSATSAGARSDHHVPQSISRSPSLSPSPSSAFAVAGISTGNRGGTAGSSSAALAVGGGGEGGTLSPSTAAASSGGGLGSRRRGRMAEGQAGVSSTPPAAASSSSKQSSTIDGRAPVVSVRKSSSHQVDAAREPSEDERQFSCPLCWELIARPSTLPCGFTLCQLCLARLLQRAWSDGHSGAVCPVLGPDCPRGRVRELPNVNVMMHNQLQQLYGAAYTARLAEADTEENRKLVQAVKNYHRSGGPSSSGRNNNNNLGGQPPLRAGQRGVVEVAFNAALPRPFFNPATMLRRLLLPHLLTVILCLCVPPTKDGRFSVLRSSNVAWGLITHSDISWRSAGTLATCSDPSYGLLGTGLGATAAKELMRLRPWPLLLLQRLQTLADFDLYHRFLGTFLLVCSVLQFALLYLEIGKSRVRRLRAKRQGTAPIALSEVLVVGLTLLAIDLYSMALWQLQMWCPISCFLVYRVPSVGQLVWSLQTLWYEGGALYTLLSGLKPEHHSVLRQAELVLDSLEDSPWWTALLYDPRLTLITRRQCFWLWLMSSSVNGLFGLRRRRRRRMVLAAGGGVINPAGHRQQHQVANNAGIVLADFGVGGNR